MQLKKIEIEDNKLRIEYDDEKTVVNLGVAPIFTEYEESLITMALNDFIARRGELGVTSTVLNEYKSCARDIKGKVHNLTLNNLEVE